MPSLMRGMPGWRPPASWRRLGTIESHAAGEPLRVIVEGLDPIPGATILEKRRFARERLDGLRRALMFEPRGHADMYGAIPTAPATPDGDLGVLFLHNEAGARCAATASSPWSPSRSRRGCCRRSRKFVSTPRPVA